MDSTLSNTLIITHNWSNNFQNLKFFCSFLFPFFFFFLRMRVESEIPPLNSNNSIRLVSFNINGYKTLSHYHPWNDLGNLSEIFNYLKADIITFQELKLQRSDIDRSIANIKGFHSFISIPRIKRGYSGVGVFIKSTRNDLKAIKAEEGITGYLDISNDSSMTYRKIWDRDGDLGLAIGGYTDNIIDWKEGCKLDSDGRTVIVELNSGLVIISVYCPANSMGTEEEEMRRCLFLQVLFQRAENLIKMGKHVIIMGDINVAPSLIDRDDTINIGLKDNSLVNPKIGSFEKANKIMTLNFRSETLARSILNDYLYDFNEFDSIKNKDKILFDLGRYKNIDRLKMYTCWNTLKNNRPMNIGSRIDLFLASECVKNETENCDIWSFLYGSDHCPIFCDLNTKNLKRRESIEIKANIKHFEAVSYYGLGTTKSIDSFFKFKSKPKSIEVKNENNSNVVNQLLSVDKKRPVTVPTYTSRKKQKGQSTLAGLVIQREKEKSDANEMQNSLFVPESDEEDCNNGDIAYQDEKYEDNKSVKQSSINASTFNEILALNNYHSVPECQHKEPSILRTTRNGPNTGRKFWCCSKPSKNSTWNSNQIGNNEREKENSDDFSCGFFKWAQK